MDTSLPPTSRKFNFVPIILIVLILIIISALIYGFYLFQASRSAKSAPFFDTQLATVTGKVVQTRSNQITIENKHGEKRTFGISSIATFMAISEQGEIMPTTDLSELEIGRQFSMNLSLGTSGELEITAIMPVTESGNPIPPTNNPPIPSSDTSIEPIDTDATTSASPVIENNSEESE